MYTQASNRTEYQRSSHKQKDSRYTNQEHTTITQYKPKQNRHAYAQAYTEMLSMPVQALLSMRFIIAFSCFMGPSS